jgi:demethylsterigmatocystin 6-O-methyltransferase
MILKNILTAMDPDSVILIDEMVLPSSGVQLYAAQIDLTMMASIASTERTEKQWLSLLQSAGLKVFLYSLVRETALLRRLGSVSHDMYI